MKVVNNPSTLLAFFHTPNFVPISVGMHSKYGSTSYLCDTVQLCRFVDPMTILQYEYKGFDVVIMAVTSTPDVNISSRNPRLRVQLGEPFMTFKAPNIETARVMAEECIDALRTRRLGVP